MGLLSVQFLPVGRLLSGKGMFEKPNIGYATDFLRSKFHLTLFNYFWLFNIMFSVVLYLIDPMAVLYAWLVPAVLVWHGGASINSLGHSKFGYRNYSTNDNSTNNIITGFLVGGEGWHNNHHAQPANPKFGHKWWEFDLGWQIIKLVRLDKK
jgi:stearoyl-CoA desaturase (delta-9 desaturase)